MSKRVMVLVEGERREHGPVLPMAVECLLYHLSAHSSERHPQSMDAKHRRGCQGVWSQLGGVHVV